MGEKRRPKKLCIKTHLLSLGSLFLLKGLCNFDVHNTTITYFILGLKTNKKLLNLGVGNNLLFWDQQTHRQTHRLTHGHRNYWTELVLGQIQFKLKILYIM